MYETLSVYDNVMISLRGTRKVFEVYLQAGLTPEEIDRVWEILDFVDLDAKANDPADTLSHGERQWLEIAMLVASRPKLMLLDEPTTGMTEEGKHRTADLIRRIAEKSHRAPGRARHAPGAPIAKRSRSCIRVTSWLKARWPRLSRMKL